jgi:hypothetical protein
VAGIVIVSAAVILILGFALGVIVLASIGIRREERAFLRTGKVSITRPAPDPATLAARGVTHLWVRRWDDLESLPAEERQWGSTATASVLDPGFDDLTGTR